ncbi:MAG: CHAT domain-containing protein, partial [Alphaproteobacteria bacterium]|nr:CHAT domain-containing protein [Alphaproteobacteria bacterium]
DQHGTGYYHIIHFDLHGALMTYAQFEGVLKAEANADCHTYQMPRYGRSEIRAYEGQQAFLAFEGEEIGRSDLAEAGEIADLLMHHQIPIAILNACQSGKQVGERETSLASRLLQSGVKTVLAMGYSVTVTAATLMMQTLYKQLFDQSDLAVAIRHARFALFNDKARDVYFNQRISLEDWLLPVVYQTGGAQTASALPLRKMYFEEEVAYFSEQAARYRAPAPAYGFVGRDVDILQIEKRLLSESEGKRRNLLLIKGMGGAGKTTLLHHLAEWWQTTRFVDHIFYFGYDEKAYSLHQIMDGIAGELFNTPLAPLKGGIIPSSAPNSPLEGGQGGVFPSQEGLGVGSLDLMKFRAMPLHAQQQMLAQKLRSERHLLILDNLESITGEHLAIRNTLPPEERAALRNFLYDLLNGSALVLLGTRGGEEWLLKGAHAPLRDCDIYDLPGLDNEAASTLAERILERHVKDRKQREAYRESEEFRRLLKLLDGYPLPLEVVLANLNRQSPQEILDALQAG